jgi:hypothetical protein
MNFIKSQHYPTLTNVVHKNMNINYDVLHVIFTTVRKLAIISPVLLISWFMFIYQSFNYWLETPKLLPICHPLQQPHVQKCMTKSMSNGTIIRPALKTRVQAPELFFYGRKRISGDRSPYSQPVIQKISVLRVVNKGTDLRRHICARKNRF